MSFNQNEIRSNMAASPTGSKFRHSQLEKIKISSHGLRKLELSQEYYSGIMNKKKVILFFI